MPRLYVSASGSEIAKTIPNVEPSAPLENHLWPSITHSSPSTHGPRAQQGRIGAGDVGLGHREERPRPPRHERLEELRLLLRRCRTGAGSRRCRRRAPDSRRRAAPSARARSPRSCRRSRGTPRPSRPPRPACAAPTARPRAPAPAATATSSCAASSSRSRSRSFGNTCSSMNARYSSRRSRYAGGKSAVLTGVGSFTCASLCNSGTTTRSAASPSRRRPTGSGSTRSGRPKPTARTPSRRWHGSRRPPSASPSAARSCRCRRARRPRRRRRSRRSTSSRVAACCSGSARRGRRWRRAGTARPGASR